MTDDDVKYENLLARVKALTTVMIASSNRLQRTWNKDSKANFNRPAEMQRELRFLMAIRNEILEQLKEY
jgi:hypothetical protein